MEREANWSMRKSLAAIVERQWSQENGKEQVPRNNRYHLIHDNDSMSGADLFPKLCPQLVPISAWYDEIYSCCQARNIRRYCLSTYLSFGTP